MNDMDRLIEAQKVVMLAAAHALVDLGVQQAHERLVLAAQLDREADDG